MKYLLLLLILVIGNLSVSSAPLGGGDTCVACTAIVGLVEQTSLIQGSSIKTSMQELCGALSSNGAFDFVCDLLLGHYASALQKDFNNKVTPDQSCRTTIKLCKNAPQCTLFNQWPIPLIQ